MKKFNERMKFIKDTLRDDEEAMEIANKIEVAEFESSPKVHKVKLVFKESK